MSPSFLLLVVLTVQLGSHGVLGCSWKTILKNEDFDVDKEGNQKKPTESDFRRKVVLDQPLYYGHSVKGILALCKNSKKPREKDMKQPTKRRMPSDCDHEVDKSDVEPGKKKTPEKMSQIELFLLKEAQAKFIKQKDLVQDKKMMIAAWVMFVIPFLMAFYLVIVGHYSLGNIPPFNRLGRRRTDHSDGVKFNFYTWMKFRILPGSHPELKKTSGGLAEDPTAKIKGVRQKRIKWCKYDKEDEKLDPKKITIDLKTMNFRFQPRMDYLELLSILNQRANAEAPGEQERPEIKMVNKMKEAVRRRKKKNLHTKRGWDFDKLSSTYKLHPETQEKKEKRIHRRRMSHAKLSGESGKSLDIKDPEKPE